MKAKKKKEDLTLNAERESRWHFDPRMEDREKNRGTKKLKM